MCVYVCVSPCSGQGCALALAVVQLPVVDVLACVLRGGVLRGGEWWLPFLDVVALLLPLILSYLTMCMCMCICPLALIQLHGT